MPPKRAKGKRPSEQVGISGSEALQLKQALDDGRALDDHTLLSLLKCDTACEGLYSKTCKVIGGGDQQRRAPLGLDPQLF